MPGASEVRTGARGTVEDLSLDKWEEFTSWWVWSAGERAVPGRDRGYCCTNGKDKMSPSLGNVQE